MPRWHLDRRQEIVDTHIRWSLSICGRLSTLIDCCESYRQTERQRLFLLVDREEHHVLLLMMSSMHNFALAIQYVGLLWL